MSSLSLLAHLLLLVQGSAHSKGKFDESAFIQSRLVGKHSVESAAAQSSIPTLSFCGNNDNEFECSPGRMKRLYNSKSWDRRVWDKTKFCHNCDFKGAKWTVTGFPASHAIYCGFAPWVEEIDDGAGMCIPNGDHTIGSYVFVSDDDGVYMGIGGPGNGFNYIRKADWQNSDASGFEEARIELKSDGGATLFYKGHQQDYPIPSNKGITANTKFRFGCSTYDPEGGFEGLEYICGSNCPEAVSTGTSAKGDPHVKNIAGHAFDILRAGIYTILNVPRDKTGSESLLSVESRVEHQLDFESGQVQCHNLWIRNLVLTGKLLDEVYEFGLTANEKNEKFFLRRGNTTTESPEEFAKFAPKFHVELSPIPNKYYQRKKAKIQVLASMKVEAGPTKMMIDLVKMPMLTASHLDFDIQNLKGLIADERVGSADMIGGLIGSDDHVHASTSDCKEPRQLLETDDYHAGSLLAASLD